MGESFSFAAYNFRHLWTSPRPYIVLFAVYAGMELCFGGVRTYLADTGQTVQALEFFILASANRIPQWIFVFGILLLLGDAPFLQEGVEFYLMRSSRRDWLTGQVLYCLFVIFGYLVLVVGMFLVLFRGYLFFANEWSETFTLCCQLGSGSLLHIIMMIEFPLRLVKSGLPYAIFALSFLYSFLLLLLLSLLCMICNMKLRMGFGCLAVTILLVWRVILENVAGLKVLHYLSPCNLAVVSDRTINFPNICYTISFFVCTCGLLWVWSYSIVKKIDLQWKVSL